MKEKLYTWEPTQRGEVCRFKGVIIGSIANPENQGRQRWYTPILFVPNMQMYFNPVKTKRASKLFIQNEHGKRLIASVEEALGGET